MATSTVDVDVDLSAARSAVEADAAARRRAPVVVVALFAEGLVQAVAVVSVLLVVLGRLIEEGDRPTGPAALFLLVAVAAWVVATAAGGAGVLDGSGRTLLTAVSCGEVALVLGFTAVATVVTVPSAATAGLPLPLAALLALAVPAAKLVGAHAPSTTSWLAAGPREREARRDPVADHRRACAATLAVIGLALLGVALLGPAPGASTGPAPAPAATGTGG